MKIRPDSKVKPCHDWVVGDITHQNIMEILNHEVFTEFREHLVENSMLPIFAFTIGDTEVASPLSALGH